MRSKPASSRARQTNREDAVGEHWLIAEFDHQNSLGINPYTRHVMDETGVDISQQTSKGVSQYLGQVNFGYVITVCSKAEAKCPIFPGISIRLYWPFDDPAEFEGTDEERLIKFREIRNQIDKRIRDWLLEQGI